MRLLVLRNLVWAACLSLVACGESTKTITVSLVGPSAATLDPFQTDARLVKTRIWVSDLGPGQVARDLPPSERSTTIEGYKSEGTEASAIAEGYDELGNVVAYGRKEGVSIEGESAAIEVQFRRSLAYVIHLPDASGATPARHPEGLIYVIDVATKGLVGRLQIPGVEPVARGISARGGESLLVTFSEQGVGKVGVLSTSDHSWKIFNLPAIQDLTLAAVERPLGIVAGGGRLSFIDLDSGVATTFNDPNGQPSDIGGRALDAAIGLGGRRAVVALDANLLIVDLETKQIKRVGLDSPGGVGLSADGQTAFGTSRTLPAVVTIALEQQSSTVVGGAFELPTGIATYSDAIPGVLAVRQSSAGAGSVLGWEDGGLSLDGSVPTLFFPSGITTDGAGRRAVVVASGIMSADAGLTVIDTYANGITPEGSTISYPIDATDGIRFQPKGVAVVYGR